VIRLPEGNAGRLAAAGIGLVAAAAVYVLVVSPLTSLYRHQEQSLQERLQLLSRLESAAAELPKLRAADKLWREKTRKGDLLFAGSSDTVAGASLQSTLKDLIEDGGATLESAELLPPETTDKFRRIAVRVSFSGDLDLIATVLEGIEDAHPAIFVDNLDIRGAGNSDDGADGAFAISLDVHGFRPS
jgi:hypothetical protein